MLFSLNAPYLPWIVFPTFLFVSVELSAPDLTPLILKTELRSSLSLSFVITFPLAFDAPSVMVSVSLSATGAAFTEIFIVYANELSAVPSWTLNVKLSSASELSFGVYLKSEKLVI